MFAQPSPWVARFATCLLSVFCVPMLGSLAAQESAPDEELARQQKIVERFVTVLEKNPRRGTALDRVYGFYVESGTLDQLVKRYQDRAKDPKDTTAWMILGLIESQRGRDAAAVEAFTKAATAAPKDSIPSYYLGQSLVLVGQPELAVAAFEDAIRRNPAQNDLLEIFQALGRVHQRAQHSKEALEVWARLEKLFPGDARVQEQIAVALVEDGQNAQALPRYEALLKLTKDDYRKAVYRIEAAELKVKLNRSQEATADLEKLLATLNPTSWLHREVRRKIEEVYLRTEDQDGLAKYYQGWLAKNPEDVDAMARLARLLARQARLPEAQVWLDKALKLAPSRKELRQTFIQQLIEDQRYPEAIAQYELLDKADPNNPDFLREWGKLILRDTSRPKDERLKAAEVVWRRLLAARPKDPLIATQVADLFRHAEMVQPALDLYLKAVELAPDQPQYLEYLGEYYHQLKRTDEALATWRKSIAGKKRNAASLARLAEVCSSFGYLPEAIPEIQAACELDPKDFSLQLKAADLFAKAEKYPDALTALAKSEKLAQNVEESEAVLAAQLKIYQLEDSLTKRTEELAARLAKEEPTAKQLFLLARYYETLRQYPEATRAIDASLKLEPQAIPALGSAARIYENGGDLKSAADLNRKLAVIDRRGRSDYLKYVAQLETQLGRIDEALKAGKELIASAPGNTENYEFYASLCFRLGQSEEGLAALRRAMRVSPNDPKLILVLAEALAGQYRTDEAIELYWQAFDKSPALDDRLAQVQKLTELYMQTNHFDKLLERLERLRRDAEDKREMTICLSQAYSSAGDFGMARQELESLLSENSRDTQLLAQLSKLSSTEGDLTSAVKYQEQLARIAPGPETEYPLATLLAQTGAAQESAAILVRLTSKEEDLEKFLKNLDSLLAGGQHDTALLITEARLREEPKNWELLYREGVALAKSKPDEALKLFQAILDLPNDEAEWCIAEKNRRDKAAKSKTAAPITSPRMSYETARLDYHYQIRIAVGLYSEEMYYGQRQTVLWSPINFAQARFAAVGWSFRFAQEAKRNQDFMAAYQAAAAKPTAPHRASWDWIYALAMQNADSRNYWSIPEILTAAKKLAGQGDAAGQYLFLESIRMRASQSRGQADTLPPLSNEDLDLAVLSYRGLAKKWNAAPGTGSSPSTYMVNAVLKELRRAGRLQDEQKLFDELVGKVQSPEEIAQALTLTASREDLPGALALFEKWAKSTLQTPVKSSPGSAVQTRGLLTALSPLMGISGAAKKDAEVLSLLDRCLDFNSARATQDRQKSAGLPKRPATGSGYSYYPIYYGKTQSNARFSFPTPGEYFDSGAIVILRNAYEIFLRNDNLSDLQKHLAQRLEKSVAGDKAYGHLALAYLAAWSDDKEAALSEMAAAAELVPQDWQLRMDVARLHTDMQSFDEALTLVNSINPLDQDAMREREMMALNLAVRLGDHERATQAAERLFGLRLDAETQIQLAGQMRRLGMNEQAEAVMSRAQRQAGSRLSTMTVLMSANQSEGRTDVAVQIAYQILRRSRPQVSANSRYSSGTGDEGARRSALQVLSASGKLKEMIAATEEQLKRSPQAGQLITTLAEYYEAGGDVAKALALQAKMVEQKPDDANLRYRYAQKLSTTEHLAEACEQYKICIKQQPQLLGNDYYQVRQTFRQAKKESDLSALLQEIDLRRVGQYYYVMELVSMLLQNPEQRPAALALLKRSMEAFPQSRTYMLDNLYSREVWELPEVYEIGKKALLPKPADVETDAWFGLSQIRSYDSDGRTTSVFGNVLESAARRNDLPKLREELATAAAANTRWKSGPLMVAAVDARLGKAAEARKVLEAAMAVKEPLEFPASARWLVGQEVETSEPLKDLAIKMYEGAMIGESPVMNSNGFEYSPGPRLLKLYAAAGRKEDARKLMVKAEKPVPYDNDPSYAAYRRVNDLTRLARQYEEMDAPADALRLYREVLTNPTLNDPAIQNYNNIDYYIREARQHLDRLLPKLAGAQTPEMVRALLAVTDDPSKPALDLMVGVQNSPNGIPTIDSQLATLVGSDKLSPESRQAAMQQLAEVAGKHPDDLSVRIVAALLAVRSGSGNETAAALAELKDLVQKSPLEELPPGQRANSRQREAALRQVALWLVAAECLKQESLRGDGEFFLTRALAAAGRQLDNRYSVAMLYDRGRVALKTGDKKEAEEHLSKILAIALTRPQVKKIPAAQPVDAPPPPRPMPRPLPPGPAAPQKGAAQPAAKPDSPQIAGAAPITLSQFKLAMTVVHLAAENEMPELAIRGVQGALAGGLPVPDALPALGGGRGMPVMRTTPSQSGPATEITAPVGRELTKVSATWRAKKYSPEKMYEALLAIVVPPSRPGEILLYEDPVLVSWADARSLAGELAIWAVAARREEPLRQAISMRRAQPAARLAGDVLLVLLALEGKDTAAAKAALASLAAQIQPQSTVYQAMSAAKVAARALNAPDLDGDALPILQVAYKVLSKSSSYLNGGVPLLSRYYISHKRRDDLKALHDSYLVTRQAYYAEYSDGGSHQLKIDLVQAATAAAELRDLPLVLDYLGRAADIPGLPDYYEVSFASSLVYLAAEARSLPAAERFALLRDWTLPAEKRRTIRFAACFLTPPQLPAVFLPADLKSSPPPSDGLLSTLTLLVEAAATSGKLEELQAAADAAVTEKIVHAQALAALVAMARGDSSSAGKLQAFTAATQGRIKSRADAAAAAANSPNARFSPSTPPVDYTWDDLVVLDAALKVPSTRRAAHNFSRFVLQESRSLAQFEKTTHLSRLMAQDAVRELAPAESESLKSPGLRLWHPGTAQAAGRRYPAAWWSAHEGQVTHITGSGYDSLFFKYPLTGTFEFEFEVHSYDFSQGEVAYGGLVSTPQFWQSNATIFAVGHTDLVTRGAAVEAKEHWNRYGVKVSPQAIRFHSNGHLVYEETEPSPTSPWLHLACYDHRRTNFRKLKLSGEPVIPREVKLVEGDRIEGWLSPLLEPLPMRLTKREPISSASVDPYRGREELPPQWYAEKGILFGLHEASSPTNTLSHLLYHRPLQSGDKLHYQFLYEPNKTHVHPALGEIAFLLEPDGVRLHWIGGSSDVVPSLERGHAVAEPQHRRGPQALPLKAGEWNDLEISLTQDTAALKLNGELVFERPMEKTNSLQFGLFHYRDQTAAQTKNMVLTGNWPEKLSPADSGNLLALAADNEPPQVSRARHSLLREEELVDDALDVWLAARSLSPEESYKMLSTWVLPSDQHPTFRLQAGFTPAQIASPAIELVRTAAELKRLPELEAAVTAGAKVVERSGRDMLALQALIAAARSDDAAAAGYLKLLGEGLKTLDPATPVYLRYPELIAVEGALARPALREEALVLADLLVTNQQSHYQTLDWEKRVRALRAKTRWLAATHHGEVLFQAPQGLTQWTPVSFPTAEARGKGYSPATWSFEKGKAEFFTGNGGDSLYFRSPLQGDFEVRFRRTTFGWKEIRMLYAGKAIDVGADGQTTWRFPLARAGTQTPLAAKLPNWGETVDCKLVVKDGEHRVIINGIVVHLEKLGPHADPWLAIQTKEPHFDGRVENVQILGTPTVPEMLQLSAGPTLLSWRADFYNESIDDPAAAWVQDQNEIIGKLHANSPGSKRESLLQYHRPLLEDGEIEYEFFYEAGKTLAHPALGRSAFLLAASGVRLHLLTDGAFEKSLAPDNETPLDDSPKSLPLADKAWNRMKLSLAGDVLTISLAGEKIGQHTLQAGEPRHFGLFRYSDATTARVRNVTYRGNWPKEVPPLEKQELALP